jgi:AraC family transcriptional regulator of arabinose operon
MAKERIVFSPLSLEDVAETSGFANYTYFHRVFRSRFGVSPKQFRMSSRTSN